MSDYETYIHWGRVTVAVQLIVIPIYFYILSFIFTEGVIWFLDTPELRPVNFILLYILGPLIMAIPLLFWTYGQRYEIADAYESFWRSVTRLPVSIKAFYGFNFLIGLIFLTPLVTPIIALFGGYFIAVYLFGWKDEDRFLNLSPRVRVFTMVFAIIPLIVVVGFFFGYKGVPGEVGIISFFEQLLTYWLDHIDILYTSALILADAATIGGIFYFIYEGAQQVDDTIEIPKVLITIITIVVFVIIEGLYLTLGSNIENALSLFHLVMVGIGILILIIRLVKGLNTEKNTSIKSWIFLLVFQLINFVSGNLQVIARSTAIFLAFVIFLSMFLVEYRHACKRF